MDDDETVKGQLSKHTKQTVHGKKVTFSHPACPKDCFSSKMKAVENFKRKRRGRAGVPAPVVRLPDPAEDAAAIDAWVAAAPRPDVAYMASGEWVGLNGHKLELGRLEPVVHQPAAAAAFSSASSSTTTTASSSSSLSPPSPSALAAAAAAATSPSSQPAPSPSSLAAAALASPAPVPSSWPSSSSPSSSHSTAAAAAAVAASPECVAELEAAASHGARAFETWNSFGTPQLCLRIGSGEARIKLLTDYHKELRAKLMVGQRGSGWVNGVVKGGIMGWVNG